MPFATACDGALLALSSFFLGASTYSFAQFFSSYSSLCRIRHAPAASVSDLRSLIGDSDSSGKLVVIRGHVQAKPSVLLGWLGLKNSAALVSMLPGKSAVIVLKTQTRIYKELCDLDILQPLLYRRISERCSSSLRIVPFGLVESNQMFHSAYVHVSLDNSTHPLPLTEIYRRMHSPWYLFMWITHRGRIPVALFDQESVLQTGKEISAVGMCVNKDGALEIKSCMQLPYFLSDMTKEEMEADLTSKTKFLFWTGFVLGVFSIGILGYAVVRCWQRRREGELDEESSSEDLGVVPEGELCVICAVRRTDHAFLPCGHRVCCQPCAISEKRNSQSPECSVCRQHIDSSPEDLEVAPEGELCVICAASRTDHAFLPCGHRVCCQPCAISEKRNSQSPECSVCRQHIDSSSEDLEVVLEGELCVMCAARRTDHAFLPCGHRVCCQPRAISEKRNSQSPECSMCRRIDSSSEDLEVVSGREMCVICAATRRDHTFLSCGSHLLPTLCHI